MLEQQNQTVYVYILCIMFDSILDSLLIKNILWNRKKGFEFVWMVVVVEKYNYFQPNSLLALDFLIQLWCFAKVVFKPHILPAMQASPAQMTFSAFRVPYPFTSDFALSRLRPQNTPFKWVWYTCGAYSDSSWSRDCK